MFDNFKMLILSLLAALAALITFGKVQKHNGKKEAKNEINENIIKEVEASVERVKKISDLDNDSLLAELREPKS